MNFSTLSPNVVLAAGSGDYMSGIATALVDAEFKGNVEYGKIILHKHCIVGSNSVILPNVELGEGVAVGALSLVNSNLEQWGLYAGIPVRRIRERDKRRILLLEENLRKTMRGRE